MTLRTRLTGLLASLLVVGILIGLPIVLLAVGGNPLPSSIPTWAQTLEWLASPDDGTLALAALKALGWLLWLFLAGTLLLEVVAQLRGVRAPRLPGLGHPQHAARRLVATAALLFVAVPLAASFGTLPSTAAPTTHAAPFAGETARTVQRDAPHVVGTSRGQFEDHIVQPGETLSELADTFLDDGRRWPEIFEASQHVTQLDGRHLTDPDLIVEGWTLRIPVDRTDQVTGGTRSFRHTVKSGDTLAELADTYLGDADRWPEIFHASTNVTQPDGRHLVDPDLIVDGWTVLIPDDVTSAKQDADQGDAVTLTPAHARPSRSPAQPPDPVAGASIQDLVTPTHDPDAARADLDAPLSVDDDTPLRVTQPAAGMDASWLLTGLSVGGAVLAGSAFLLWGRRRELQYRNRRPGRALAAPDPILAPVQKTLSVVGAVSAPTVTTMDLALRRLARDRVASGRSMPALAAVQLTDHDLVLHLAEPASLELPWSRDDAEGLRWRLAHAEHDGVLDGQLASEQPAPYPLLVTSGSSDNGDLWLLNLEQLGNIRLEGDTTYAEDFVRYLTAELAVNPWSRSVRITCWGTADVVRPMNPSRFRPVADIDQAVGEALADAQAILERADRVLTDAVSGRSGQLAGEAWGAQVVIVPADAQDHEGLKQLSALIDDNSGRTAAAVVVTSSDGPGCELHFTATGRVRVPRAGLDLVAVGLTVDEAGGCAALLAQAETTGDSPMPVSSDATEGWRSMADEAGALRDDLTVPSAESVVDPTVPAEPLLVDESREPVPGIAAEPGVRSLSPQVSTRVRVEVEDADQGLDRDVADWFADRCVRPRLALLGPVSVRAHGVPIAKRKPFFIELLAYIALREHGATPEEVADAFGHSTATARSSVTIVREWLGTNPRTGRRYLPDADKSKAALARGVAVYQVEDLLIDVDLFRRLRLRGQARGTDGVEDLVTALRLVTGRPFDQRRPNGWTWLIDSGIDSHMVCAIVDVAHLLNLHFLQAGDSGRARAATETALLAAPYDAIPRLDLAAVTNSEGHVEEARRIVREQVCNVPDEDGLPADLGERVEEILAGLDWFDDPHDGAAPLLGPRQLRPASA